MLPLVFLIILLRVSAGHIMPVRETDDEHFKDWIKLSFNFFGNKSSTLLISSSKRFLTKFSKYSGLVLESSAIVYDYNKFKKEALHMDKDCKNILIVNKGEVQIVQILQKLKPFAKVDSRIVLVFIQKTCTRRDFQNLFAQLWSLLHIRSIIILDVSNQKFCKCNIYSFDPFARIVSSHTYDQVGKIGCPYYFHDYRGQNIKASLFKSIPTSIKFGQEYVGMDPMILRTIEQMLNVSISYSEPPDGNLYGFKYENGTVTGAIKELLSRRSEIAFNQFFIKSYNSSDLEFTKSVYQDSLCIVVPAPGEVPRWMTFFINFPLKVWIGVAITILTAVVVLFLIRKFSQLSTPTTRSPRLGIVTVILDLVQILYNAGNRKTFSSRYYERIFLGTFFLFSLIYTAIFQSSMMDMIESRRCFPTINTLLDLEKSGYLISTSSVNLLNTFDDSQNSHFQTLSKRLRLVTQKDSGFKASLSRKSSENYRHVIHKDRAKRFHTVKECAQNYLLGYLVYKNSYFKEDFDRIIDRIVCSGLIQKWQNHLLNSARAHEKKKKIGSDKIGNQDDANQSSEKPFSVFDLQVCFYLLTVGFSLSLIAFCCELIGHRVLRKHTKTTGSSPKVIQTPSSRYFCTDSASQRCDNGWMRGTVQSQRFSSNVLEETYNETLFQPKRTGDLTANSKRYKEQKSTAAQSPASSRTSLPLVIERGSLGVNSDFYCEEVLEPPIFILNFNELNV